MFVKKWAAFVFAITLCCELCLAASPREYSVHDAQATALVSRMTLAEKIGQMTQAELSALEGSASTMP